ncbi:MerR family transcriptional regulator [Nocardioides terrisoli]|uniref:MerR family transcriptional regulator n=1 Tax=Nocardioides terrisoli TaxID=3388267 RepID=UPI00287B60E4|nr:MerR family transcriptional regulator [Nocardioides marmorisolisilvae]
MPAIHDSDSFSIGGVAARTGLSVHALRFYERENLMVSPVQRTSGGRRIYTQTDVDWLTICTKLRASGMPLASLQTFADLVRQGPGNEHQRLDLLRSHQARVQAQLDALTECLDLITWKVAVYEEHVATDTAEGLWDPAATSAADARDQRTAS